jgi:hypothetical protein
MKGKDAAQRFAETFREAMGKDEAVAVYANESDLNDYEVGFVEAVSEEDLILLALSPKGEADGRLVIPLLDVHRVEFGSSYTKKLELLYQYRGDIFDRDFKAIPATVRRDSRSLLEYARDNGMLVNLVDRFGYGPSGFVRSVADDYVEVERLGSGGEPDGTSILMLDAIDRVHVGRREEQMLLFLYRYHYELKRLLE